MMKLILPLSVTLPRKTRSDKVFILNLNTYRNTHYMTLNQAKVAWSNLIGDILTHRDSLPGTPPYRFVYTVFPSSNRKFDLSNVLSVIQKFTDDALINYGVISDDSYKVIPEIDYRFGQVDKANPRIELVISSIEGEKTLGACKTAESVGL
jgi:hypothetical protein